ncbi:MAG TPA: hypothetical protein DCQ83_04950 [Fibrobacteres bacterium]|jgi:mRNA-degrading endonuclease HigB of HigAB toxin-antitoxin module|nr:hypothetical protein [Fibrobacterota bacterium]
MITKKTTAEKIEAYLHHETTLAQLVEWSENAMQEGDFDLKDATAISSVISRLGVADVKTFGLSWDECEALLHQLGYSAHVEVTAT